MLVNFLTVGLGGALGAMMRFGVSQVFVKSLGISGFWATMTVNILGSFVMGLLAVWLLEGEARVPSTSFFLLATGMMGGFTTFSAFSLDVVQMMEAGRTGLALGYIFATVALAIIAIMLGMMLMRARLS